MDSQATSATWANISTRSPAQPYVSPAELQRLERVAVGRICGCKDCMCCRELMAHTRAAVTTGKEST